jgi:hypothetical protein
MPQQQFQIHAHLAGRAWWSSFRLTKPWSGVGSFLPRRTKLRDASPRRSPAFKVITLRAGPPSGWVVVAENSPNGQHFASRVLALAFARAYAMLQRPSTLRLIDARGNLEDEQHFDTSFR